MSFGLLGLDFNLILLSFIMARMVGCIYFNPIFGQRTVPARIKAALTLFMSIFVYSNLPSHSVEEMGLVTFGIIIVKEVLIGFLAGFIIRLFMSVITMGGEVMDFHMGMAMAKIYDPTQQSQVAISSGFLNVLFMFVFFATNSHLTMMQFFCLLGEISPYGEFAITQDFLWAIIELLNLVVLYAIKLTLPIFAVEMITEVSVGLLMKAVPNIQIISLNIEFKMLVGIICMVLLVPSYANFLDRLIEIMFDKMIIVFGL